MEIRKFLKGLLFVSNEETCTGFWVMKSERLALAVRYFHFIRITVTLASHHLRKVKKAGEKF